VIDVDGGWADLDLWLPDPAVRTHHHREATVGVAVLWAAAQTVRIGESRVLGRLVRWRIPGTRPDQTYREMFTSHPFVVLDDGEHHLFVGLCGKIWAARPALATLGDRSEFMDWRVAGTARVLFAQWVAPAASGAALFSEVRVGLVDRHARLQMRGIWPLISRFEGLIGAEPLRLAVRRAEARASGMTGAM
jgi:hypothetical protein